MTQLKFDALEHLSNDDELRSMISSFMGISPQGVQAAIFRKSKSLTTYKAVIAISKSMGKEPAEILEEVKKRRDI